jgi:glycosyltransferase involved in cell wall biosynthesis
MPKDKYAYNPHAVCDETFKPLPESEVYKFRKSMLGPHADKQFLLFWNNRNARRKMTGDVIASFAKFAKKVGKQNTSLIMHTDPKDQEGQDVVAVAKLFDIDTCLVVSSNRIQSTELNMFYNACDCTINISNNEGFGLGTLESICAGTPIAVNMTGGLQFQIGDWWKDLSDFSDQEKLFEVARKAYKRKQCVMAGEPIFPAARCCTGSQQIPFIYADYVNHDDVVNALDKLYKMGRTKRKEMGKQAREWALANFNLATMVSNFDKIFVEQINKFVENKKNENPIVIAQL